MRIWKKNEERFSWEYRNVFHAIEIIWLCPIYIQPVTETDQSDQCSLYQGTKQLYSFECCGLRTASHKALWLQGLTGTCMQWVPAWYVPLLSLTTTIVDTAPCPIWVLLCSGPDMVLWLFLYLCQYQKKPARRRSSSLAAISLLSLQMVVVQISGVR